MGKASSAKKVARAARAGGVTRSSRPRLTFPLAIIVIFVLGSATVVYARTTHDALADSTTLPSYKAEPPTHWHNAYGFWACDKWVPALKDITDKDDLGIHTHGDGIIHEHPFKAVSSGERARLKTWALMVGVTFFDDGWKLPDGTEYRKGAKCGDKPARVAVYRWKVDDARAPAEVFDHGFGDIYLSFDRGAYTFAVMPEDAPQPAPKPESVPQLDSLEDMGASGAGGAGGAGDLSGLDLGGAGQAPPGGAPGAEVPIAPAAPGAPAAPTP
jgi:hypothetical protein